MGGTARREQVRMKSGRVFTRYRQDGGRLESLLPSLETVSAPQGDLSTDTGELRPPESG